MSELRHLIKSVQDKCAKMVQYADTLKQEVMYKNQQIQDLEEQLSSRDQQFTQLQNRMKEVETVSVMSQNGQNTREARLKINELVREIDKCISLLNK